MTASSKPRAARSWSTSARAVSSTSGSVIILQPARYHRQPGSTDRDSAAVESGFRPAIGWSAGTPGTRRADRCTMMAGMGSLLEVIALHPADAEAAQEG